MLADYETYAVNHGVLEMPDGYEYIRQVMLHTGLAILKRSWPFLLGSILFIAAGSLWLIRRRRASR